jgi:hypothetical protein
MHPRLQEIVEYNAAIRADLAAVIAAHAKSDFDRREKPDGWNGHQIIHHLGHVEGAATKMLEGATAKLLAEGALPMDSETSSMVAALSRFNVTDRKATPIQAPERLVPPAEADIDVAWPLLQGARQRSLAFIHSVDGRDLTKIGWPHPLFGPLNGYEWLVLFGAHEARHLAQLKAALANS